MLTLLPYSASKKKIPEILILVVDLGTGCPIATKEGKKKWLGVSKPDNGKENQGSLLSPILWPPANGTIHSSLSVECGHESVGPGE